MNKPIIIQGALQSEIDYLLKILNVNEKTSIGTFFMNIHIKDIQFTILINI